MSEPKRILLLGGTEEAVRLNQSLASLKHIKLFTSLAGRTSTPKQLSGDVVTGGFGGAEGLAGFVKDMSIDTVLDASHPFAGKMTGTAIKVCKESDIQYLRLERPAWQKMSGDNWIEVKSIAASVPKQEGYSRIFLTIGRQELSAFSGCRNKFFLVRSIEAIDFTPTDCETVHIRDRGPFDTQEEIELLNQHRIDLLVSKNSGGSLTYPKIEAARHLGLPVLMVNRPQLPTCPSVSTVEEILALI